MLCYEICIVLSITPLRSVHSTCWNLCHMTHLWHNQQPTTTRPSLHEKGCTSPQSHVTHGAICQFEQKNATRLPAVHMYAVETHYSIGIATSEKIFSTLTRTCKLTQTALAPKPTENLHNNLLWGDAALLHEKMSAPAMAEGYQESTKHMTNIFIFLFFYF